MVKVFVSFLLERESVARPGRVTNHKKLQNRLYMLRYFILRIHGDAAIFLTVSGCVAFIWLFRNTVLVYRPGRVEKTMKEALTQIVDKECILDDSPVLEAFGADRSFAQPLKPRMVVRPKDALQVQKIVKWANTTGAVLVPVSSGAPHFRGDTVPSAPNAVIVDLSEMKKILGINRTHRMVVVEPGVTYGEVQAALADEGMTLSTSLAPRATKSVLASVLEVEPRLNCIHQWNYQDPLRCMEVVWGDGVRMFTGEAGEAPPDLVKQWETEKWQVSGTGPFMFDFYRLLTSSQGTMGIATWASLKCELLPEECVAAHEESISDIVRQANHKMVAALAGVQGATALSKVISPCGPDYWKEAAKGGFQVPYRSSRKRASMKPAAPATRA